jgi:hypothetical protein
MTERLEKYELEPVYFDLAAQGLILMAERYGPNGRRPLAYHNEDHLIDVADAGHPIAKDQNMKPRQYGNYMIALFYHDYEQDYKEPFMNEALSAEKAVAEMRKTRKFENTDYVEVEAMIMATATYMKNGRLYQNVNGLYLPQKKNAADADMASLGRNTDVFWDRALNLYQEWNPGQPLSGPAYERFVRNEVELLRNFRFYTPEAAALFPNREKNLAYVESIAYELEAS